MPNRYIQYKKIQVSLPEATYRSAKILAQREDMPLSTYVAALVKREVHKNGLPVYFVECTDFEG